MLFTGYCFMILNLISQVSQVAALFFKQLRKSFILLQFWSLPLGICFRGLHNYLWLPWWLSSKESACNVGDPGSIPGQGRFPGEGTGNPLQYSCLQNSMDRGVWWATVHGIEKSQTQLNGFHLLIHIIIVIIFFYMRTNFIGKKIINFI